MSTGFEPRGVRLDEIQRKAEDHAFTFSANECEALRAHLDVLAVHSASAKLSTRPWRGKKGARVTGEVRADVEQACVVTLEPVRERILEEVDMRYILEAYAEKEIVDLDPQADEAPDLLPAQGIDLTQVAVEHLTLGLDPYPRKDGASVQNDVEKDDDDKPPSPFAALGALTQKNTR